MLMYAHVGAPPSNPPRRRALPPPRGRGPRAQDLGRRRRPRRDRPGSARRPGEEARRMGGAEEGGADSAAGDLRRIEARARRDPRRLPLVIVLDPNVLLYALGGEHPAREPARRLFDAVGEGRLNATTTVDVIQEFAHVYSRRRPRAEAVSI